ncbi:MAG: serine/threonine protein kinase [Myxococcaceae bacterium]|nr:serine/threonine protein kinase [Myxococcaceae bacterium]
MPVMPGAEPNSLAAARPGTVLCGKYRVERTLARGGMGTIVVATHLKLDRLVAIKLVNLEGRERALVSARFMREARAAGRLVGEHVVRIMDLDEAADGTPFLVMELLDGTDLEQLLARQGRVAPARAVDWALQTCAALAEAHARDVVHRDVKPANLFLVRRLDGVELIKLLDFGISKIVTDEVRLTQTASTLGSPLFMSPEQLLTPNVVDRRTDVWSLGVTLYRWLAGVAPFDAGDASAMAAQIAARPPTPLTDVVTGLPDGLSAIVMRCLEKDPVHRYASVLELADALEPFRAPAGLGSAARVHVAEAVARAAVAAAPGPVAAPASIAPAWTLSHDVPGTRPDAPAGTSGERLTSAPLAAPPMTAAGHTSERTRPSVAPTSPWRRPALFATALALAGGVVLFAASRTERTAPPSAGATARAASPESAPPVPDVPTPPVETASPGAHAAAPTDAVTEAMPAGRDAGTFARVRATKAPRDSRDPADLELK